MHSFRRVFVTVAALVFALAVLVPATALASSSMPMTWEAVLAEYPDHEIQDFNMQLNATNKLVWSDVVAQLGSDTEVLVKVFGREGIQINFLTNNIPLATGQHLSVVLVNDTRGANLFQVIIKGDVLGTGNLSIAQLTRLASALSGARPLEGPYALAGDINGRGGVDIGDLATLAQWLTNR